MEFTNTPLELASSDFQENKQVREHVKLLLNSALGKFNQKDPEISSKFVRNSEDIDRLLAANKEIIDFNDISDHICQVQFRTNYRSKNRRKNPTILAFITARARIFLHKKILLLAKENFSPFYCDTDSILFAGPKEMSVPLQYSLAFGDFKHELGETANITSFQAYGRKNFSIVYENEKGSQSIVKVCGMNLESKIVQDELTEVAKEKKKYPKLTQIRKVYQKEIGVRLPSIHAVTLNNVKFNCERKVEIESDNLVTKPWGY